MPFNPSFAFDELGPHEEVADVLFAAGTLLAHPAIRRTTGFGFQVMWDEVPA